MKPTRGSMALAALMAAAAVGVTAEAIYGPTSDGGRIIVPRRERRDAERLAKAIAKRERKAALNRQADPTPAQHTKDLP